MDLEEELLATHLQDGRRLGPPELGSPLDTRAGLVHPASPESFAGAGSRLRLQRQPQRAPWSIQLENRTLTAPLRGSTEPDRAFFLDTRL